MPRLDQQGDGMKSFMGLLLNIVASAYPVVLVDEPEAFLHPPQARLIGRMLGDEKDPGAQVLVATGQKADQATMDPNLGNCWEMLHFS